MIEEFKKKIIDEIESIDLNSTSQLNALGMKILVLDIINKTN